MSIRLRPHHLLCLLTYVGKGYSPAFVANYDRIVARLDAGEPAELVEGPDDICAPMLDGGHHCLNDSVAIRDATARAALARLFGDGLAVGTMLRFSAGRLAAMRAAFADGTLRAVCTGCQWTGLCDAIAADGFRGTRLLGEGAVSPPCARRNRD